MTRPRHTRSLPERSSAPVFKRSDALVRGEAPTTASSRRLTPCSDASEFLEWIKETLPSVLGEEVSLHSLDRALLILTKEYLSQRQHAVLHGDPPPGRVGFLCLPEVYHQKATELYETQQEALRRMSFTTDLSGQAAKPQVPAEPVQSLFIGEELDEYA